MEAAGWGDVADSSNSVHIQDCKLLKSVNLQYSQMCQQAILLLSVGIHAGSITFRLAMALAGTKNLTGLAGHCSLPFWMVAFGATRQHRPPMDEALLR